MTVRFLSWERILDRASARELQAFTCTSDFPRTPEGRKLLHPKKWEREAQSLIRQCSRRLKDGDILLVGRSANQEVVAAAHLVFDRAPSLLEAHIACLGVDVSVRGRGGAIATEMLAVVTEVAIEKAQDLGLDVAITADIHTNNRPSELLAERAGFEPQALPLSEYQSWLFRPRLS